MTQLSDSAKEVILANSSTDCVLVKLCYYENAKDFSVKFTGTGIVKDKWCYLKENSEALHLKKKVLGMHFKILEVIDKYPSDFNIEQWQHEGESDLERIFLSRGDALLDQVDGIDSNMILSRLKTDEVIRADVAYSYGRNYNNYRTEDNVVLCGNKCYLSGGSTKKIDSPHFKIVKIYDDFPADFKFHNYMK